MLSNQGHTAREIAAELGSNERAALKWIDRFNRHGVAGLEETLRSGSVGAYNARERDGRRRSQRYIACDTYRFEGPATAIP